MALDADSFRGKLYLLVIDKLVIGALIAVALVAYDTWNTESERRYEDAAKEVQTEFERAKLVREFVPLLADPNANVITRAYLLRAALVTGSIDPEAGIELGRVLIPAGLEDSHFKRVMAAAMPQGIPAVSRHAADMAMTWSETQTGAFRPQTIFNPESGRESIPEELRAQVREARLWRAVLAEAVRRIDQSFLPLQHDGDLASNLFGLFVLLHPAYQFEAVELSHSPSRGVRIIGNLSRLLFSATDDEAAREVGAIFSVAAPTKESIALSSTMLAILQQYGPPHGGSISESVARVLTHLPPPDRNPAIASAYYWLQWQAADLLDAMADVPEVQVARRRLAIDPGAIDSADEWIGINPAKGTLLSFLREFTLSLQAASDEPSMSRLAQRYESGALMRRVVSLLGSFDSPDVRAELRLLARIGEDKLMNFPFLREEIDHALSRP